MWWVTKKPIQLLLVRNQEPLCPVSETILVHKLMCAPLVENQQLIQTQRSSPGLPHRGGRRLQPRCRWPGRDWLQVWSPKKPRGCCWSSGRRRWSPSAVCPTAWRHQTYTCRVTAQPESESHSYTVFDLEKTCSSASVSWRQPLTAESLPLLHLNNFHTLTCCCGLVYLTILGTWWS